MKDKYLYKLINSIVSKVFILIILGLILLMTIFILSINVDKEWLIVAIIAYAVVLFIVIICICHFFNEYFYFIKKILSEYISNNSKDKQLEILKQINSHLEDLKKDLDSRRNIWL